LMFEEIHLKYHSLKVKIMESSKIDIKNDQTISF
jgi:hypothetical protein